MNMKTETMSEQKTFKQLNVHIYNLNTDILGTGAIDAAGFISIRLVSGAVALFLIFLLRTKHLPTTTKGSWFAGFMLFLYAITFL